MPIITKVKLRKHHTGVNVYIPQDVIETSKLDYDEEVEVDVDTKGDIILKKI